MSITNVQTVQSGLVGVLPSLAYISTTDTLATVVGAGYLNKEVANGAIIKTIALHKPSFWHIASMWCSA